MTITARARVGVLAALVGATLPACDDATGPIGAFDPELTAAAMAEMATATEDMEQAWVGMGLAATLFDNTAAAHMLPGAGSILMSPAATRSFADLVEARAFFPANFLGVTFVWSEAEGRYVASDEAGAPADGIRVVYYAVDPFGEHPASPLTRLGHIDLRDLSTAASDRLGVKVQRTAGTAATLADYFIDLSYAATASALVVEQVSRGYLSNGTDRLDFDLANTATLTETTVTLDQSYEMSLAGTDVRVDYEGSFSGDWAGENVTVGIDATITGSGTSVRFEVTASADALEGGVYHGDKLVATVSGTPEHPVFTSAATGEELTAAQLEALAEIFHAIEDLFDLAEGIFGITD